MRRGLDKSLFRIQSMIMPFMGDIISMILMIMAFV